MKKAQLLGKPFIFIFIMIVAVLIILFGLNIIIKSKCLGEDIELENFIKNLNSKIQRIYNLDYGSSASLEDITVPNNIREICFLDPSGSYVSSNKMRGYIAASQSTNENLFLITKCKEEVFDLRNLKNLEVEENFCKTNPRKLNLKITNAGDKVVLSTI